MGDNCPGASQVERPKYIGSYHLSLVGGTHPRFILCPSGQYGIVLNRKPVCLSSGLVVMVINEFIIKVDLLNYVHITFIFDVFKYSYVIHGQHLGEVRRRHQDCVFPQAPQ